MGQKEVLVAFRGHIPETMFELINEETGLLLGPLKTMFDQVATAGRGEESSRLRSKAMAPAEHM